MLLQVLLLVLQLERCPLCGTLCRARKRCSKVCRRRTHLTCVGSCAPLDCALLGAGAVALAAAACAITRAAPLLRLGHDGTDARWGRTTGSTSQRPRRDWRPALCTLCLLAFSIVVVCCVLRV